MMDESSDGPPAAPKVDPETLALRGEPGRVVRFRRGVIIAIAAFGSVAIIGIAWVALKPITLRTAAAEDERAQVVSKPPPDALASAPKSYGEVPLLGPPLPGDLGGPILEHQRSLGAASVVPAGDAAIKAAEQANAERRRLQAEHQAARESGVMVQLSEAGNDVSARPVDAVAAKPGTDDPQRILDPAPDPNSQQHRLELPVSPWTLSAGSVIAAAVITGINSDLPGLVTAQVTQNVYDSATGRTLLIPQGSRLIGSYDSAVAYGQERALVVWQRIILPDGASIRLDNVPATDTAGYAGLTDEVDRHGWQVLKGIALSTFLEAGTEISLGDESDLVRAVREATQESTSRAGDQIVSRNLDIQPTITVRPGWPLRVIVHKDLVLAPWRG